ncbi:RICIN domain-containing protein [Amycolatopsis sp. lyj-112]|uniref:RICIN domain-containing protein n=1 Tax=Amycolatopsis sp. lyj-112 TaxID=2789288 RepID=UPI00397E2D6B
MALPANSLASDRGWQPPPGAVRLNIYEFDEIYNSLSNRCIDADTGSIHNNGTKIQMWACNGYLQQRWYLNWGQTTDYKNVFSGRCLDADINHINENGARVQLWDCNGRNQQGWWFVSADRSIHSAVNGKCLDIDLNNIHSNGAKVQLWDCNGRAQQQWIYHLYPRPDSGRQDLITR